VTVFRRPLIWCFVRALALYPAPFRDRFGGAMVDAFRDALQDREHTHGSIGAAALGLRALADHVGSAIAERRVARRRVATSALLPAGRGAAVRGLVQDVRVACRRLRRQPGVTILASLTLGVGVGAATAVFSLVDASLLRPLALPAPDELVAVFETSKGTPGQVSYENLIDWSRQARSFAGLTGMRAQSVNLTGLESPDRVRGGFVTHEFFAVARVAPAIGRPLGPADDRPNAPPAAVINHSVWQRHFGGRADILNRPITLNNISFTVVGVMPADFRFPFDGAEVWMPARLMPASKARSARTLTGFGRLRRGVTLDQARADLQAIAAGLAVEFPAANGSTGASIEPLHRWLTAEVRDQLMLVFGLVIVLVAAAVANVTSLQLAETTARRSEIAIRAALGAGRRRIARQVIVEHLLVAVVGGTGGVLLAYDLVPMAVSAAPAGIFGLERATVDGRVLLFAVGLTVAAGLGSALVPAIHWAGQTPSTMLAGAGRTLGDRTLHRAHGWLVAAQIAIATVLLSAGGLLVRSYVTIASVDPGFDAQGLHTLEYRLPANKYDEPAQTRFHAEVVDRVAAVPGVIGAAAVRALPFSGNGNTTSYRTDRTAAGAEPSTAEINTITDDYFRLLGIRLLEGRSFDSRDTAEAPMVVVVSRSLAEREWPGETPIGRIIMPVGVPIRAQVIGVVEDIRHRSLDDARPETCYVRNAQNPGIFMTLVAKVEGDAADSAAAIRRAVWSVDPDQPVWKERSLESLVGASLQRDRFLSAVLSIFSAAGLLLVIAGVYGIVSQSVTHRSREIGLRMALGASRRAVLHGVVRSGLKMTVAGSLAGFAVSLWVQRLMQSWLYQTGGFDVVPHVTAALVLIALAAAACHGPARRAAAIDPSQALRRI
jgi:predicted permease